MNSIKLSHWDLSPPGLPATANRIRILRTGLDAAKRPNKVKGSVCPAATSEMCDLCVCAP